MKSLLLSAAICAFAASAAHGAAIFTETFSNAGDTSGWYTVADTADDVVTQDPVANTLLFTGSGASLYYVAADVSASGGAFAGDYTAAGINGLSFTLTLAPSNNLNDVVVELVNFTNDETWHYTLTPAAAGVAQNYFIPLPSDGTGWTQISGDQPFSYILGNVEEMGLAFTSPTAGNVSGVLDNVAAVPEPAAAAPLALASLFTAFARRRRRN